MKNTATLVKKRTPTMCALYIHVEAARANKPARVPKARRFCRVGVALGERNADAGISAEKGRERDRPEKSSPPSSRVFSCKFTARRSLAFLLSDTSFARSFLAPILSRSPTAPFPPRSSRLLSLRAGPRKQLELVFDGASPRPFFVCREAGRRRNITLSRAHVEPRGTAVEFFRRLFPLFRCRDEESKDAPRECVLLLGRPGEKQRTCRVRYLRPDVPRMRIAVYRNQSSDAECDLTRRTKSMST